MIGGGPAGAVAARVAARTLAAMAGDGWRQRFAVHIFDSAPCSSERIGVSVRIGESIPPAATPLLRRLGLHREVEDGTHLVCPGSISLWNGDRPGHNDFMLDVIGRGYHLDRAAFDRQLLTASERSGAVVHHAARLTRVRPRIGMVIADGGAVTPGRADGPPENSPENSPENQPENQPENPSGNRRDGCGYLLDLSLSGRGRADSVFAADFVIDATGGPAAFARRIGVARNILDDVVFHCAFFDLPSGCDLVSHTLVEAVADGWWYAARLPGHRLIVTFCTDMETTRHLACAEADIWHGLLRRTRWLKTVLPDSVTGAGTLPARIVTRAAPSALLSAVCGDDWLAVGDAASQYDPITSAGITKALMHGEVAGQAAARRLAGGDREGLRAYQRRVFDDFLNFTRVRRHLYGSETRFPDAPFWRRRLGRA